MVAEQYHNPNSRSGSTYTTRFAKQKGKLRQPAPTVDILDMLLINVFKLLDTLLDGRG
jgi:hypothetical protein